MTNEKSGASRPPAMQVGEVTLSSPESKALAGIGRGIRVLIVEDERDTLMTLGVLLRSEEFAVEMASSGTDAIGRVEEFRPHVVLLDIGMPGRNGYEVASHLRSTYGEGCPTLIALTAYTAPTDKARAHESGFHHHISKPYDPVRLLAAIAVVGRTAVG